MANQYLTQLTALSSPADADVLYIVDISDTTDGSAGTSKKVTLTTMAARAETLTNKTFSAASNTLTLTTDSVDAIAEIASGLKSGSDATLVTGTAGTTDYTAKWNADGDLVDGYEVLDEDDMSSDSATKLATQQSIKAYTDSAIQLTSSLQFFIDGGGSAIGTGVAGWLRVPFACTITQSDLLADQSGSIVIDVWKDTYANYPPTDADSITASATPTISTAIKDTDSTLTGWTTSITAGDILYFNVDSCTTITQCLISLTVTRS